MSNEKIDNFFIHFIVVLLLAFSISMPFLIFNKNQTPQVDIFEKVEYIKDTDYKLITLKDGTQIILFINSSVVLFKK